MSRCLEHSSRWRQRACCFFGSIVLFLRGKTVWSFLQLLGSGCLVVVVLTQVSEALHLFPWMQWGATTSIYRVLFLASRLFPIGYLLHALREQHA